MQRFISRRYEKNKKGEEYCKTSFYKFSVTKSMTKFEMEEKELREKIEFCSLLIKYGKMVDATSEQSIRAFKLKENLEEELRVLRLKNGK